MLITPVSFNGLSLNSASFETHLLNPLAMPSAKISFIEQPDSDATDADAFTVDVQNRVLTVKVKNYANRYALISQLRVAFKRGTKSDLVAYFSDDATNYVLPCRVVNIAQDPDISMQFLVTLQSSSSTWRAQDLTTVEWALSGAGSTVITVGGNDETRLIASLVFSVAPGSGYFKQALYQLPNNDWALGTHPWCVTLDTATLIGAGQMQADCDDLRVMINGAEVRRWIANPNNASTKIWFNVEMARGWRFTLKTAIVDTEDLSTIELYFAADGNHDLSAMPTTGILYHGSEWFAYSQPQGQADGSVTLAIARGVFGTTRQTHAAADAFAYIQNVITLQWGNPIATDPADADAHYDDTKPMFDLAASTNTSWVWDSTSGFYDPQRPRRTGAWFPITEVNVNSQVPPRTETYTESVETLGTDVMGMQVLCASQYGVGQNVTATLWWILSLGADIIASVDVDGTMKRSATIPAGDLLPHFRCMSSGYILMNPNNPPAYKVPVLLFSQLGTSDDAWHAFTGTGSPPLHRGSEIYIQLRGQQSYVAEGVGTFVEVNAVTVTIDDPCPGAQLFTTKDNITMDLTLKNATNQDSLSAVYPLLANKIIAIDSENSIVTYDGINFHRAIILNDETRPIFIRLQPGSNTIQLLGAVGIGTLTLTWYARRL